LLRNVRGVLVEESSRLKQFGQKLVEESRRLKEFGQELVGYNLSFIVLRSSSHQ
jgi:hypothetical protein